MFSGNILFSFGLVNLFVSSYVTNSCYQALFFYLKESSRPLVFSNWLCILGLLVCHCTVWCFTLSTSV